MGLSHLSRFRSHSLSLAKVAADGVLRNSRKRDGYVYIERKSSHLESKVSLLDMDWPELENWAPCKETHRKGCSSLFSWPLSAESSCFSSCAAPHREIREDATTVSKNHCLAEKRRRDRINVQLSLLRNLIPRSDKMDKAALLGSVVEQLKDLKGKAKEANKVLTVPADFDEVTIDCFLNQDLSSASNAKTTENISIQVSICCDDRHDLFAELTQVFKNLKLTIINADMACLGGRIKSVMILRAQNGTNGVCINSTIQSLKGMLSRIASFSIGPNCNSSRSKRQRFFCTGH